MLDHPETIDGVTGTLSRQGFDAHGRAELRRATRYKRPTSMLLVEPDRFGTLVERYGRDAGDAVLRQLSLLMRIELREFDKLGRIDDAAMAILLPETAEHSAMFVAERLCQAAADMRIEHEEKSINFTISVGVTCCIEREDDLDGVLRDVDAALCIARREGANSVARSPHSELAAGIN